MFGSKWDLLIHFSEVKFSLTHSKCKRLCVLIAKKNQKVMTICFFGINLDLFGYEDLLLYFAS